MGPTGSGKTTLGLELLDRRDWVVAFGTKRRDSTLDQLRGHGYRVIREWPPPPNTPRVILWPEVRSIEDIPRQRETFRAAMVDIYQRGGWCLYLDELRYLSGYLRLPQLVELLWQQGRSLGVSLVAGAQRPAFIPLAAYDSSTHLFLWPDPDERNLKRYAELAGADPAALRAAVASLVAHGAECQCGQCHEVLSVNQRTGDLIVTRVERREQ